MELTPRFESLEVVCIAGISISGIILFGGSTPEIRFSGFVSLIVLLVIFISMVIISFKDENPFKNRTLPVWSNVGFFLMWGGVLLFGYPVFAISIVLTGMIISMYAIHYRECKNRDVVESNPDIEINGNGAEGEI
jgi:hypothetical protein